MLLKSTTNFGHSPLGHVSYMEFPVDLYWLSAVFCDPAFLLRNELVERSSLDTSSERLFIRSGNPWRLFPPALCVYRYLVCRMNVFFSFSPAESVNTLAAFWANLHLVELSPPLPDMSRPRAPIPEIVVPACSGCRVRELERSLVWTEVETLRRSLKERDAATAGVDAPENIVGVDQTPSGAPGSSRGIKRAHSSDSS